MSRYVVAFRYAGRGGKLRDGSRTVTAADKDTAAAMVRARVKGWFDLTAVTPVEG